jgi:hypothetical protein
MKPTLADLEHMNEVLALTEKARAGCLQLKTSGLIPYMVGGDPEASLADAVRLMKDLIEHTGRGLKSS